MDVLQLLVRCLVTGALWGQATWGTYWDWDPLLTSTAALFLKLMGTSRCGRSRRIVLYAAIGQRRQEAIPAFADVPGRFR